MKISFLFADSSHKAKALGTWLIKKLDKGPAAHVAVAVEIGQAIYIFEAVAPKSRVMEMSEWLTHYKIIHQFDFMVPDLKSWDALNFLESQVEKPYSISQLILIALTKIAMPLQFALRGAILNHERALICTEIVSRFVERFMNYTIKKTHDQQGIKDTYQMVYELSRTAMPWKG